MLRCWISLGRAIEELDRRHAEVRGGPLLPAPPHATLEPAPGRLDGLGAQAGQARRAQPPAARRRGDQLRPRGRRPRRPPGHPLRHHPGHRHAAPTRCRATAGRDDRAPAESGLLRRTARPGGRRLRAHPAPRQHHAWSVPALVLLEDLHRHRRLSAAVGMRNRIAHQYGTLDLARVYAAARDDLGDLESLARALASGLGGADHAG